MIGFKDFLTESTSKYYYHVTFKSKVSKIKSGGLKPLQTSNWVKNTGKRYNEYAGVYAFEHPLDAFKWALKMDFKFKEDVSIVRIKKGKSWVKDPSDDIHLQMGKGKALMSEKAIPANQIVDSFDVSDFGKPIHLGISQHEWFDSVTKKLQG